jgi:hypothetical protein
MGAASSGIRGPVALVGLGLMGGSLARALRAGQPELEILGVDPDSRAGARALPTPPRWSTRVRSEPCSG